MDDRDKTEMADAIRDVWNGIRHTHKTQLRPRFICRSGRIDNPSDISICSPASSKSIIINTTAGCMTIKAMLATSRCLEAEADAAYAQRTFICAVALQKESITPLHIAGNHTSEVLYFKSILARMTAQTIRRPGISKIFSHLLDFEGNEIYIERVDVPHNATFGQVSQHMDNATALGVMRGDKVVLNPPDAERITSHDQLILLAEDDGIACYGAEAPVDESCFAPRPPTHQPRPITLLILGTNDLTPDIVSAADTYGTSGSDVIVAADGRKLAAASYPNQASLSNIDLGFQPCDIFDRAMLDDLMATLQPDNVLVMSDGEAPSEQADAQTLMLLLQLRDIRQTSSASFMVTCELRDSTNQCLAEATDVTDFIISDRITALMMTQVSETRTRRPVIDELLADSGKEIYLKPMGRYMKPGVPFTYATLRASARRYDEIALGYKRLYDNDFDIVLNPANGDTMCPGTHDMAIILADNPLE